MQDPSSLMTMQGLGSWDPFGGARWGPNWLPFGVPFIWSPQFQNIIIPYPFWLELGVANTLLDNY